MTGKQKNMAIHRVRMRRHSDSVYFVIEKRIWNSFGWEDILGFPTRREAQKVRHQLEAYRNSDYYK